MKVLEKSDIKLGFIYEQSGGVFFILGIDDKITFRFLDDYHKKLFGSEAHKLPWVEPKDGLPVITEIGSQETHPEYFL